MEFLANKRANFYYSLFGPYYSNIWIIFGHQNLTKYWIEYHYLGANYSNLWIIWIICSKSGKFFHIVEDCCIAHCVDAQPKYHFSLCSEKCLLTFFLTYVSISEPRCDTVISVYSFWYQEFNGKYVRVNIHISVFYSIYWNEQSLVYKRYSQEILCKKNRIL